MNNETEYWKLIREIGSLNDKWADTVITKAKIIDNLIKSISPDTKTILFPCFNPIISFLKNYYEVTVVCSAELFSIFDLTNVTHVESISSLSKPYDVVVALDEFFTYGDSEKSQRDLLDGVVRVTNGWLITTLLDYKNFAPYKKNQIDAVSINGDNNYKNRTKNFFIDIRNQNLLHLPSIATSYTSLQSQSQVSLYSK